MNLVTGRRTPRLSLSFAVVAALGVASLAFRLASTHGINGADLDVYLRAGAVVLEGGDLYAMTPGVLPFTYSPFAALVLSPLAPLGSTTAFVAMTALSLLAYAFVVVVVARALGRDAWWAAAMGMMGLSLEPTFRTLALGQVNLLLLALVVADLFAVRRSRRGWLLGLACGCKIIPGVLVVVFLIRREWDVAWRALGGLLISVAIGALVQPAASLMYWSGGFADLGRFGPPAVPGADNQALVAVWARSFGDATVPGGLAVVLGLLAVAAGAAAGWRHRATDQPLLLSCVAMGGLLASPVSWTHHWVWCVPVVMTLLARGLSTWAATVGIIFWLGPMWIVYSADGWPTSSNFEEQLLAASYLVAAGLVWLAAAFAAGRGPLSQGEAPQKSAARV